MGRVINPEGAGKERTRKSKEIVLSIRELMKQQQPDDTSRDLAAFIGLGLLTIHETVDTSVTAWEKRGYWVKADRFRMEWEWTKPTGETICQAVLADDWATIAVQSVKVAQKLMKIEIPEKHRLGKPWIGAWKQLSSQKS